jgi:hypothetical protein
MNEKAHMVDDDCFQKFVFAFELKCCDVNELAHSRHVTLTGRRLLLVLFAPPTPGCNVHLHDVRGPVFKARQTSSEEVGKEGRTAVAAQLCETTRRLVTYTCLDRTPTPLDSLANSCQQCNLSCKVRYHEKHSEREQ